MIDEVPTAALRKFRDELDTVHGSHLETLVRALSVTLKHLIDAELGGREAKKKPE